MVRSAFAKAFRTSRVSCCCLLLHHACISRHKSVLVKSVRAPPKAKTKFGSREPLLPSCRGLKPESERIHIRPRLDSHETCHSTECRSAGCSTRTNISTILTPWVGAAPARDGLATRGFSAKYRGGGGASCPQVEQKHTHAHTRDHTPGFGMYRTQTLIVASSLSRAPSNLPLATLVPGAILPA